jgi:hypothetical protein
VLVLVLVLGDGVALARADGAALPRFSGFSAFFVFSSSAALAALATGLGHEGATLTSRVFARRSSNGST